MQKTFLFVVLNFLIFDSKSQSNPFKLDNIDWEIIYCYAPGGPPQSYDFNHYKICGDTLFNNSIYKRIFYGTVTVPPNYTTHPPPPSIYNFYGFFRQDSVLKRNYLRLPSWSYDSLLMDYSLNVGDSIRKGLYYHSNPCSNLIILKIDTLIFNNFKYRIFYTDTVNVMTGYFCRQVKGMGFIEGLGHVFGIFQEPSFNELYCSPFENCSGIDSIAFNAPCNNLANIAENKKEYFSVFPNPTSNQISISSSRNIEDLKITNVMGQTAFEKYNISFLKDKATIDISHLENGIYFITIISGKESSTQKLIVQH